ncbi:isoprenylcysteine carboxyl methyltransferase [Rodentibacter trehalosifermentans]|uniref:Isoprenylcysteine carboxyl methyltransferase n=3 Tax=Pasteurellaceae TaxID=712 RepID=A0A1V3IRR7_9PAST|nr:isoprenylcysteine carboxyl methyltransferase [Rodentibacter rarus]OOF44599.1 isoprenylcysteine carboxyl methyltransferase [Rodentibacter rarus]OOF46801.1 isoprenylcysteine carboxyl methyltransferase [Rodentibacter trehalosifermentans]OOF49615.1 isoprenylcysteine carboxyl methyltransferase [Rodentibacter trehalosifermentans]
MRSLFPLPPPLLCFFVGVVMYLLPSMGQYPTFPYLISGFILLSACIGMLSLWQFHQHKTTIDPQRLDKSTHLVTSGIFRVSRNPMYLSLLLLLMAWALYLGHFLAWSGVVAFILLMNRFQIAREEIYLERKFGEAYRQYQAKVRRWL